MKQSEKGASLFEALIGLAITACIVGPVIMTATTTIVKNSGQATEQNAVLPQVQNVGYSISRDVQIASDINPTGDNGFPLFLDIPTDGDPSHDYAIEYSFVGNKLMRKVFDSWETLVSETLIADYIDTDNTTFSAVDHPTAGYYKLTVTAAGDVARVTGNYEIQQRVSLDYY